MLRVNPSERLTYRRIAAQDRDFLFELDQNEEVMRFLTGGRKTTRQEVDEVFIPRIESFNNEQKGWGLWQASLNNDCSEAIGWILVRPLGFFTGNPQPDNLELGWRFCRQSWGKGYATEAARAVVNALRQAGCRQFSAIALADNQGSINIMKKLGMQYQRTERYTDAIFDDDVVVYSTGPANE
ncbi:GNAT family N-acetyltransferase [uncultured Alteromonas sp.]|jgi:RimJ/RimL family protein N-acetyltransferase|uniref:GNAT family N-acetyltransferase n=1 Tax=uncultured Alteromonas sp. TaxID=179113 RepID=UPI0025E670E8|nr:GNAT family N-acetyltransferase [uncultured Alteromonas sp.]